MSNKKKINLIRSLKPGDIVITGNHIGAVRYLGPLEGLDHKNQNPNDRTRIYNLYAGIELTEPNGHMDGSMHINGKKITYFTTKYGNTLKKRRKKRQMNTSENESKYDNDDIDDSDDAKYGILIPAISIQKKIDSFTLLKKITMVFEQYKIIKKRLNYYKNQPRTDQQSNQNEQSLIDIKTNSDLISPPTTSGYGIRSNIPISQPSIISNNVSTTTAPGFSNNSNNNNNSHKYKKFSTAPVFNNGFSNAYDNEINNNNENTQINDKLSLRKINSAPYLHHSEMDFTDSNNTNNGQINNNNNAINNGYLMHRHSHTIHGQSYEQNTNQRLFAPQSNVTTPHIDDEINNSSFPSISEEQPAFGSHSKSYTNPTMARMEHKRQLNSSLPAPHHFTLNRGQSYNKKYNKSNTTNNTQSRARGNSFQSYNSYVSHMATKRTPEPPNNIKSNSPNISTNNSLRNNKLSISSTANKLSQSPLSCPVSPAISHQTMVINNEDKQNEDSISNDIIHSTNSTPKMESETCKKQNEMIVKIEDISELPKIPNTILSPEHSQQSDQTMNTQRSRVISVSGHHPSASMYTHAPLNHWNDSNGKNKLTSVGGSADKNKDLSSLAIKISSPRHTRPKSAMDFNQRESVNVNNKINHFANQDSIQLKNLLEDLKKNKLNQINIISEIDNNKNTMDILSDDSSESNTSNNNNNDLPKLMDNVTTAATVHSPTADVLENMVTHSILSPEEKLAEVENNEDEKQLLPTDAMSDIATPIPKEAGANIIDVEVDEFDIFDVDSNTNNSSSNTNNNIPKRLSLTESSLRKHNKRRSSRDNIISDNEIKKIKNYVFAPRKINIHHHVQTLSEPMLPKFALMMNDFDSSEDEKSASSDGEDTQSLGMENNLDDSIHTHDVTEDEIQYMNQNNNNNILTPVNTNVNNTPIVPTKPKNKSNDKLFSPTFTADSISRRSSINLTSGVWDYITPKNKEIDINNVSNITLYNLSNDCDGNSIGYQTPKQQYIKRMVGPGNTSSTPTYSSYKTRHEYLRDMTYFTTLHRAQQFKKLQKEKIEGIIENKNEEKSMSPQEKDNKHIKSNSMTSLDIIQEKIFDDENNNKNKNKNNNNEINIKEEEINIGHRTQLSCDTRAAIEGGIEPYKPTQHTLHQSAMV